MKRIAFVLLAASAALVANSARADHVDVRGSINFGAPAYVAPGYVAPAYGYGNGYWQNVSTRVLVPGHWETSYDYYGRPFNRWEPAHYELQTRRVWVNGWERRRDWREHQRHEWMEHERREHEEHEEHEHGYRGDGWRQ